MIKVNGVIIKQEQFPDNTHNVKIDSIGDITWCYDQDSEIFLLYSIVQHMREKSPTTRITLTMPYIPNARFDRTQNLDEVFTLKYFAKIINSLHFDKVCVLNPHSNVSTALLDRVEVFPTYATEIVREHKDALLFFPDEGARKRYSDLFGQPYATGMKKRNWRDGRITSYEVIEGKESIANRDILIIDDICSYGGTFYYAAEKLKKLGARNIYLYVDHLENAVTKGKLWQEKPIAHIYTTDSIFTANREDYVTFVQTFRVDNRKD